jgi:hypothetical protein
MPSDMLLCSSYDLHVEDGVVAKLKKFTCYFIYVAVSEE